MSVRRLTSEPLYVESEPIGTPIASPIRGADWRSRVTEESGVGSQDSDRHT
jgi:hypothetical protein